MCLVPGPDGSVRWLAVSDGKVADEQAVTSDGKARPVVDRDCRGTETARWLERRPRLVRTADLTCGKDAQRKVTGLSFLAPGPVWVEAQAVDAEGTRRIRLQRYRRAPDQRLPDGIAAPPVAPVPLAAAEHFAWNIDDVIETSRAVPPEVLQAAISEVNAPFPMNAKALIRMADAGVAASVIDLMVALSNPRKFVVHRADGTAPGRATYADWPGLEESLFDTIRYAGFAFPWFYDPWLGMWGYEDYYWSSCGYGWCGDSWGGGWVEVEPGPPVGGGGGGQSQPHGRAIKGLGYTQVDVRAAPIATRSGSSGSSGSSGDTSSSSGSSSSGSSASPGGYSSGGSGGGDRTAQPRGPGE